MRKILLFFGDRNDTGKDLMQEDEIAESGRCRACGKYYKKTIANLTFQ